MIPRLLLISNPGDMLLLISSPMARLGLETVMDYWSLAANVSVWLPFKLCPGLM
ncbi:uncharacterized protein MYCGRDRAFT_79751, partial [Zymoseptoria tritici IPO323]